MIHTHYLPVAPEKWTPVESVLTGPVFWQFLPPTIAMWVRVDDMRAVQVRDYTRVRGTRLEVFTLCEFYKLRPENALTVVEYDDEDGTIPYDGKQTFYDSMYSEVVHPPGYPCATGYEVYVSMGWGLEIEIAAYGGNNDGAPGVRACLYSTQNDPPETFFVSTPGTRHIRRPFIQVATWAFDWTGGSEKPTMDIYVWERTTNVAMT